MNTISPRFVFPGLWLAAFAFALIPSGGYTLEFFGACVLTIFLWSFLSLASGLKEGWVIPKSRTLAFAGLFFALALSSLLWSEVQPVTLLSVCLFSILPMSFFIGGIRGNEEAFKKIAIVLAVFFFVLGLWAVAQYFFLNDRFMGQARHPLADPSSLGAFFSLALFCAIGWMLYEDRRWRKILAALLVFVLMAGITATVARGAVFAFIPGAILMTVLLWPRVKKARLYLLAIVIGLAAVLTAMEMGTAYKKMGWRIADTVTMKDDVSNHRTLLWESASRMIVETPWLGRGFGTFYLYLPEYKNQAYTAAAYHAHNDPLEFWSDLGIMGPVLFYAFLISAALRTRKALINLDRKNDRDRLIIITTFSALLSMVVHSHVSFNLYTQQILMMAGMVLAVWFFYTGRYAGNKTSVLSVPANTPNILNLSLLALPFLMIGGLFASNIAGEHYTNKASASLFDHDMDAFVENINRAGNVSNGMNYRAYLLAVNVPLTILEAEKTKLTVEEKQKLFDQANGLMGNVIAINPRVASSFYYKGKALELAGEGIMSKDQETIEDYYRDALRLDPMHLGARLSLARWLSAQNRNRNEIYAVMEPGLSMFYITPVATTYYQELAKMYLTDGNYVKAREVMAKMVEFQQRIASTEKHSNTSLPQAVLARDPAE